VWQLAIYTAHLACGQSVSCRAIKSELDNPQLNRRGNAMAFCLRDVQFLTPGKVRIPIADVTEMDTKDPTVGRDFLTYRTQKNGEDGEQRQHTRNSGISGPCHITCLMTIVQRFVRLVGDRSDVPLCVCRADKGRIRYLTDNIIVHWFRNSAAYVYKLDPVKDSEHLRK
jgi:hypothetical protein